MPFFLFVSLSLWLCLSVFHIPLAILMFKLSWTKTQQIHCTSISRELWPFDNNSMVLKILWRFIQSDSLSDLIHSSHYRSLSMSCSFYREMPSHRNTSWIQQCNSTCFDSSVFTRLFSPLYLEHTPFLSLSPFLPTNPASDGLDIHMEGGKVHKNLLLLWVNICIWIQTKKEALIMLIG